MAIEYFMTQRGRTASDATATFDLTITKTGTLKEFIDDILTKHESGSIGIKFPGSMYGDPYIKFKGDKIETSGAALDKFNEFMDRTVLHAEYHGGYGLGSYLFVTDGDPFASMSLPSK